MSLTGEWLYKVWYVHVTENNAAIHQNTLDLSSLDWKEVSDIC